MPPSLSWNVLFYSTGRNPSEDATNKQLLTDMTAALTSSECAVSAQLYSPGATARHWITSAGRTKEPLTGADASSAASLRDFLDAAAARAPAHATMLVLCGHGSGLDEVHGILRQQQRWMRRLLRLRNGGFPPPRNFPRLPRLPKLPSGEPYRWGPNPATGSFLTNDGIRQAIAASSLGKVDVLALNACSMGMLEVMHELRDVASVQVSSQVDAQRWPYGAIIRALSAQPSQSAGELAKTIVACVGAEIRAGRRNDSVAALRSGTALVELAGAVDRYAAAVTPLLVSDWKAVANALAEEVHRPDDPHAVDLGSLADTLGRGAPSVAAAATEVRARLADAVLAQAVHPKRGALGGLSLFCPIIKNVDLAAAYKNLDFRSNRWATFLKEWQAELPSD